jgi:hypothetical protein
MSFSQAVASTPHIRECFQNGLAAFGGDSSKIHLLQTRACDGSVNLDHCLAARYPSDSRWDYCFAYNSEVYFVEVHPAQTSEVNAVIKKLQWLKSWLQNNAPEIDRMKAKNPFYWIQTSGFNITKTSPQYRRAREAGLLPIARLELKN